MIPYPKFHMFQEVHYTGVDYHWVIVAMAFLDGEWFYNDENFKNSEDSDWIKESDLEPSL